MKSSIKLTLIISFFLIPILLNSCSQQQSGWRGTIEEVDGMTVVKNPKEPIYGEEVFSLEGEFIRNISTAEMSLFTTKIDTEGNIIGMISVREEGNSRYELKKFDPDLNYLYSIASSPLPTISNFDPFMAVLRWDVTKNNQVVFGYPKTYEIRIIDSDGNEVKKITKEYDPVEVTQEDIDELEEMPPTIKVSMSKYHPAYNRIFVDDELRIFVSTWEKKVEGEGYYYDVFDGDGKYIAKIPLKVRPQAWKNGKLYTIEEDEDGYHISNATKSPGNFDLTRT